MLGFQSIEKNNVPRISTDAQGYAAMAAVGVIAGVLAAYVQTPLHLPGHKALLWMTPVLACRILTRARAGASTAAGATIVTALLLDGRLAGGITMMPLVILCGMVLDAAVIVCRHWNTPGARLSLLAAAGAAGNVICFIKRLFDPTGDLLSHANFKNLIWAGGCYAFFGFTAGLLGALAGYQVLRWRRTSQGGHPHET